MHRNRGQSGKWQSTGFPGLHATLQVPVHFVETDTQQMRYYGGYLLGVVND